MITDICLPEPDKVMGLGLIQPITPKNSPKGWTCSRDMHFEKKQNYVKTSDGQVISFATLELVKIVDSMWRPKDRDGNVCCCDDCMKVHKDRRDHWKEIVIWRAKKNEPKPTRKRNLPSRR